MENIVCKSCGGSVTRQGNYYVCDFCRSKWMIDSGNDVHAVERANAWEALRNNDFEKAAELFENIIVKDATNHEAFWGRALALNGIVYVTDYNENKKVPTCNNITEESFLKNKDVQKAISLAPTEVKESYQKQAEQIEKIRVEWLNKASKEPAYDVFISFKDSDREHGIERTQDSIDVQDLYTALVQKGYNVFFSRVTLRDKVSEQYEPYIYNALKTAKVMIVFGEKAEYFNAVWVKNEWGRFKARVEKGEKHKNSLITVYKGVNPYEIPVALTGGRQAIDYSIPSNYEVLMNHIKRVIDESEQAVHLDRIQIKGGQMAKKSSKIKTETLQTRELGKGAIAKTSISEKQTLDLAHSYLMGKQWDDANKLLDDLLFNNPNLADAIWYKLQVKFQVTSDSELFKKISSFAQEDYDTIVRVLNCAEKERATYILNSMYGLCKNVSENTNLVILNTVLPFNYEEREEKIAQAFVDSISSQRFIIFKLLLSTLDSKDVDTYIKYNLEFAKTTRNIEAKEACLNNIISVDEGNKEAQKMCLNLYLDRDDVKNSIKTLETILKYSSNHKKVVYDLLVQIKDALNSNEDCLVLREVIKYYPGELIEIKDLLLDVAFIMIRQGHFEHAKYLLSLILTVDENNSKIYWGLCLVKTKSRLESEISKSDISLKQVPEYTKYLTMVDETRRQECFKIAKKQENAEASRKKAKKFGIFSGIAAAVVAVIVAVVMVFQNVIIPSNQYKDANTLIANGRYEEARDIYESLGDYKNATKHIVVLDNMKKIDDGEYQTAVRNILFLGVPVKVNYALDGGSFNSSLSRTVTVDEEERFTSLSSFIDFKQPAKTGYNFSEWEHVSYSYVADGDFTLSLKAKWTTFDYTLTYNLDGGSAINPEGYDIEDDTFTLTNPTKTGYSFDGWTSEEISTPTKTVTIEKGSTGNKKYTAHWSANTYKVTYDANGGTASKTEDTATYDKGLILATAEKKGYKFLGWYEGSFKYDDFSNWERVEGLNLKAKWEIITYTITYKLNGGQGTNKKSYTVEDTVSINAPEKTGYSFDGWTGTDLSEKSQTVTIPKGTIGDKEYTANWTVNTYKVTYDANGGTVLKNSEEIVFDTNIVLPIATGKEHYTFGGWYYGKNKVENGAWKIGENAMLVARWVPIAYSITYNIENGKTTNPATYTIEDNIALSTPTRDGYTFIGWTGTDLTEVTENVVIPKGEFGPREYTAHWTPTNYEIIYNLGDGGTTTNPLSYTIEQTLTLNEPVRDGYTFIGWTGTDLTETTMEVVIPKGEFGVREYTAEWLQWTSASDFFYQVNGETVTIQSYLGDSARVVIPEKINGKFVTALGDSSFCEISKLKEVLLPNSLEAIGIKAFRESGIQKIVIPNTVEIVGESAFASCANLTSVELGSSMTSIEEKTFSNCDALKSVVIPDGIIRIRSYAFSDCNGLVSLFVGNGVTSISSYAFSHCSNLTNITLGNSIDYIGTFAFEYCSSLKNVTLGNSVTCIDNYAFQYCSRLTNIKIGNLVESIGAGAFAWCKSLTNVEIGNAVSSIGARAFEWCSSLTKIIIPKSVKTIKSYAFTRCDALKIYCEIESQPAGWEKYWFSGTVYWGYMGA